VHFAKLPIAQDERLGWNRRTGTLALLAFAMLIVSLDQYIVVVALPEIRRELGYSAQTLQSVVSAYTVASSGFLLLGGRAADLLGRRRTFLSGLALYAGGSLFGGLSTSTGALLAARALQGFGGALVFPATLSLLNTTFAEGRERNRALAVWGGAGAAGLVVGVFMGGLLPRRSAGSRSSSSTCRLPAWRCGLHSHSSPAMASANWNASSTCRGRSARPRASRC
jgi:MFS family permease